MARLIVLARELRYGRPQRQTYLRGEEFDAIEGDDKAIKALRLLKKVDDAPGRPAGPIGDVGTTAGRAMTAGDPPASPPTETPAPAAGRGSYRTRRLKAADEAGE